MLGNDEELHRATHAVDEIIHHVGHYEEDDITVDDLFPVLQNQITGGDDAEVTGKNDTSERYITVLMNHCRNDIRAARAGIILQGYADPDA